MRRRDFIKDWWVGSRKPASWPISIGQAATSQLPEPTQRCGVDLFGQGGA
jgi:hypothetical protein